MKCTILVFNALTNEILSKIDMNDKKRRILGIYKKYKYVVHDSYYNGRYYDFDKKLTTTFKQVYILNHDEKEVFSFCISNHCYTDGKKLYDKLKELYLWLHLKNENIIE